MPIPSTLHACPANQFISSGKHKAHIRQLKDIVHLLLAKKQLLGLHSSLLLAWLGHSVIQSIGVFNPWFLKRPKPKTATPPNSSSSSTPTRLPLQTSANWQPTKTIAAWAFRPTSATSCLPPTATWALRASCSGRTSLTPCSSEQFTLKPKENLHRTARPSAMKLPTEPSPKCLLKGSLTPPSLPAQALQTRSFTAPEPELSALDATTVHLPLAALGLTINTNTSLEHINNTLHQPCQPATQHKPA
ncbi:hypothetical protein PTTG_26477 [Puccinia triticina 1-1 BBBD Race 1]|uniref:Uncharacterized protein n=1 Tax=Puccinia triticina (isolate 1-1 / race 1 (BBBD)) TaxID=630390 RepID=A0A180GT31_PUCT1|nr:hypothetical protein PTTG_26477 [Puccinia triticina 1-1 BBBD Race 1]